ncbi:ATP-binding protein [Saprospiraceae bacterium]|nr:ATP-binding protein [Bacteroidota bacterium]MDB4728110.1 ATP-binding protein [Saprospiraceae bacterium]
MKTNCFKPAIFIIGFLCFAFQGISQETRVDSLFAIWSDTTNSAEVRVEAYYQRFNPLKDDSKNPEVLRWAFSLKEAQKLAQQIGKTEYAGRFLFLECGNYIYIAGEQKKGIALLSKALKKSLEVSDYMSAEFILRIISENQIDIKGLTQLLQGHLATVNKDPNNIPLRLAPVYYEVARLYYWDSQLLEALQLFQKIIKTYDQNNLKNRNYANTLGLIGGIHRLIGNYDEAEQYQKRTLYYKKQNKFPTAIAEAYVSHAMIYSDIGDYFKAQIYLDSALLVTDCSDCIKNKAIRVQAGIYNLKKKYDLALQELLPKRESFLNHSGGAYSIGAFFSELSNAYFGLHQYQKAIAAGKRGIELSNDNLYGSLKSYKAIYQAYNALGNHQSALDYYKKYITSRDARTKLRNGQNVTKQELTYQYEQERLKDSLQLEQQKLTTELAFEKEINKQRNTRNLLLALGLIAAFIALGLYSRYRFVQKTKAELEAKNKIIEAEKEKAQASEQAKHQFLANMSHEIRTPMNAIKGMTDILIRREPQDQQRTYLNAIKESSNSLLVIINDILDMSKIEAGKIDLENIPFSLQEVIQNVKMISQFKAEEKGLTLQTNIETDNLSSVKGDPTRLHQIILNLVGNAIKFTEKGVVTIQLKTEVLENKNKVNAHFCVSDTGVGIGQDRLEKIFESFEQAYSDTTRKFGGTGLGLSISKKLVEIQKGKIWAESTKGKGSQFFFSIPYEIAHASEIAVTPEIENNTAIDLKGVKILLVEDNDFNAIVAKEELEDAIEGVNVEVAENGVIAVEKVIHGNFDIILMDVQMPVMNGYEATKAIRNLSNGKANIPIIAMTANVMKEEVERCYEVGMNDFIGKPFDTPDLLNKIQHLIMK